MIKLKQPTTFAVLDSKSVALAVVALGASVVNRRGYRVSADVHYEEVGSRHERTSVIDSRVICIFHEPDRLGSIQLCPSRPHRCLHYSMARQPEPHRSSPV